jgi:hypothetical protein
MCVVGGLVCEPGKGDDSTVSFPLGVVECCGGDIWKILLRNNVDMVPDYVEAVSDECMETIS